MSSVTTNIMPVLSQDPLDEGLRILARIIARDIMAKRARTVQALKKQGGENNANIQDK